MSWFGGKYIEENRNDGPGAYYKITVSATPEFQLSDRGYLACPIELSWGKDGEVMTVTAEDYQKRCEEIFGFPRGSKELTNVDEMFKNASVLYLYRINGGEPATSSLGTAQCTGTYGNNITLVVEEDAEAGVIQHDLKNTKATFQASGDTLTVTFSNVPDGYQISGGLYKQDSPLAGQAVVQTQGDDKLTVKLSSTLATDDYKYKAEVIKDGRKFAVSTATVHVDHTDSQVATIKVQKSNEQAAGSLEEPYTDFSVTYSETTNSVTATYASLTPGYTVEGKLKKKSGGEEVTDEHIEKTSDATSVTYTFGKGCEVGDYTLSATVAHEGQSKEISSCDINVKLEGQDVEESVSASVSNTDNEDYSEDIPAGFIVRTIFNGKEYDKQAVATAQDLQDNLYVKFNKEATLKADAGLPFTGGTDAPPTGETHDKARAAFESYAFNILACPTSDKDIQNAYIAYVDRMRDEYGKLFEVIMPYNEEVINPNNVGVIRFLNKAIIDGEEDPNALTYWLAGAEAGCAINRSLVNTEYTGSYTPKLEYTMAEQKWALDNGIIMLHRAGDRVVFLNDCNSLTDIGEGEGLNEDMKQNQTIRTMDSLITETASIFTTYYLGFETNDDIGRISLKNRLIKIRTLLAQKRAIQPYDESLLSVEMGNSITSVKVTDSISVLNAMLRLYYDLTLV